MIDLYGRRTYTEDELCDIILVDPDAVAGKTVYVDHDMDIEKFRLLDLDLALEYLDNLDFSLEEFDQQNQQCWFMPDSYQQLDIAAYVLSLCENQDALQRAGQELLIYAERNLLDLLKYLKYLVDVMRTHDIIWGVGRGSSVASYVLYLLGIHKVNSLYYDLDITEFLR
jgi:DNA polymerase III alpha subunit